MNGEIQSSLPSYTGLISMSAASVSASNLAIDLATVLLVMLPDSSMKSPTNLMEVDDSNPSSQMENQSEAFSSAAKLHRLGLLQR